MFTTSLLAWALGASHIPHVGMEIGRIFAAVGRGLFEAGLLWVTYLGLEPYVRRHSPDSILGWTKLVSGHWRDPRVGVDVMVGVSAGLAMTLLYAVHNLLPALAGFLEPMPLVSSESSMNGVRYILSGIASDLSGAVGQGMLGVAGVVGFVLLLRSRVLAVLAGHHLFHAGRHQRHVPGKHAVAGHRHRRRHHHDSARGHRPRRIAIGDRGALHALRPAARPDHDRLLELARAGGTAGTSASSCAAGLGACYYARNGVGEKVRTS